MNKQRYKLIIEGMSCSHCELKIEEIISGYKNISDVEANYSRGEATFVSKGYIDLEDINKDLNKFGYKAVSIKEKKPFIENIQALYILIIILGLYTILNHFQLLTFLNYFPKIQSGMSYGMLFIIGLLTSLHCVAMCGGVNLLQSVNSVNSSKSAIRPNILYNLGRIVSYTSIGGIVGAIGSSVTLNGKMSGSIAIMAGVFMVIMGLNMLNVFPWLRIFNIKVPKFIGRRVSIKRSKERSSFIIGILNGFMPCGPLQSMQIYALSTGSFYTGALSMFIFSLGTVPLVFGMGTISSSLNKKFTGRMLSLSAMLVIILGVGMLKNGLGLSGVVLPSFKSDNTNKIELRIEDGYQIVNSQLDYGTYPAITVKEGIPVKWIINVDKGRINSCNDVFFIPEYDLQVVLYEGENLVEFTPTKEGQYGFSCWMGMIRSSITVVNN